MDDTPFSLAREFSKCQGGTGWVRMQACRSMPKHGGACLCMAQHAEMAGVTIGAWKSCSFRNQVFPR